MKATAAAVAALALQLCAFPCAGADAKPASRAGKANSLTVYHWWILSYETAALDGLVDVFKKKYPEVAVQTPLEPGGGGSAVGFFPLLRAAVHAGNAPEAFQMHPGYEAQPFFDAGLLAPIDELWASEGLLKAIPPVVRDMSRIDGHYYSVPINVHRTNVLWYNKALLDKSKINPASLGTWDGFFKAADDLRASGVASPVVSGIPWTVGHVFECILASQGMEAYEDWINGKIRAADDPRILKSLEILKRYLSYANRVDGELSSDNAMKKVVNGSSAFVVMGDWAVGAFREGGLQYGKDFGALPVPGTKGVYGLTIDAFQHPAGAASPQNSERWFRFVVSPEGQKVFNVKKGSIPARSDLDVADYDPYQKAAMADFKSAKSMYPSVGIGVPEAYKLRFVDIMGAFFADRDVEKAAAALASRTTSLSKTYTRTWSLR